MAHTFVVLSVHFVVLAQMPFSMASAQIVQANLCSGQLELSVIWLSIQRVPYGSTNQRTFLALRSGNCGFATGVFLSELVNITLLFLDGLAT